MPAEVVSTQLIPHLGQELIKIMDDYGTEFHLYVPVGDVTGRQGRIDGALLCQSANETALETYAVHHGIDIGAAKVAGVAKKAAIKGSL